MGTDTGKPALRLASGLRGRESGSRRHGIPARPLRVRPRRTMATRAILGTVGIALLLLLPASSPLPRPALHAPSPSIALAVAVPGPGGGPLNAGSSVTSPRCGTTSGPDCRAGLALPAAAPRAWINASAATAVAPPLELWASLVWDPIDGYLVLFGGCIVAVCPLPSQTWTFFNGTWHNITALSPQPPERSYATMAFDGSDGYVVLFGGVGATTLGDTWTFLGGQWTNQTNAVAPGPPPARWGGGLAYDRQDGYLALFGGMSASGTLLADTWSYSGGAWSNLTGSARGPPAPRYETAMAWDDADQEIVLTDGYDSVGAFLNDTWTFQNGRWNDVSGAASPLPPARSLSSLTYDGAAGFLLEFGGYGASGARNDTWTFQNNQWTDLTSSLARAPSARGSAAAMEDTIAWTQRGPSTVPFLLLFGGDYVPCPTCGTRGLNDTWVFESPSTASGSAAPPSAEVGQPVAFTGAASGGTPPYTLAWTFADGSVSIGSVGQFAFATVGAGSAHLTIVDAAGAPAFVTVSVIVVPGPSVVASATPSATDVGVPVKFAAIPSAGTAPYVLAWNFGDGATSSSPSTDHSFATTGVFPVVVTTTDSVLGSGSATVSVAVHPRPTAAIVAPPSPLDTSTSGAFSASIAGGTAPFRVAWSFGDGGTASTPNTTWSYASPGSYLVTLNVTDAVNVSVQDASVLTVATPVHSVAPTSVAPVPWVELGAIGLLVAAFAAGVAVFLRRRARRPPRPATTAVSAPVWDEGPGDSVSQR